MARIFVTGSADGLGQMAARLMVGNGHRVVLHARNATRAKEALAAVPGAESAVFGDLSSIAECRQIAADVNALGGFDAVIHNTNRKPAPGCHVGQIPNPQRFGRGTTKLRFTWSASCRQLTPYLAHAVTWKFSSYTH